MKKYRELTNNERTALGCLKMDCGRMWKSCLNLMWVTGSYGAFGHLTRELQTIRNDFGPTWLANWRG